MRSFNAVRFGGLINAVGYLGGKAMSEDQIGVAVLALRRWVTYKVGFSPWAPTINKKKLKKIKMEREAK